MEEDTSKNVISKISGPDNVWRGSYIFWCPGCYQAHVFDTRWTFSGDFIKPTFSPSLLVYGNEENLKETNGRYGHRCHSFVREGKIQFLNDCTHHLKGQTVDLTPWDEV